MRLIGALGEKGRDYVTGCMSGSHPSLNSYTRPQTHCEVALGGDSLRKHVGLDEVIGIDTYNEVRIHIREEAKGTGERALAALPEDIRVHVPHLHEGSWLSNSNPRHTHGAWTYMHAKHPYT